MGFFNNDFMNAIVAFLCLLLFPLIMILTSENAREGLLEILKGLIAKLIEMIANMNILFSRLKKKMALLKEYQGRKK
jgi:hypothetical protein